MNHQCITCLYEKPPFRQREPDAAEEIGVAPKDVRRGEGDVPLASVLMGRLLLLLLVPEIRRHLKFSDITQPLCREVYLLSQQHEGVQ